MTYTEAQKKTYTEAQKRAIYKWRQNNKEKYNSVCLKSNLKYYDNNKEEISEYKKKYWINKQDLYKIESKVFRNILI